MPTPDHRYQTSVHRLESYVFADASARTAGTGYTFAAVDVGRIAYQSDNGTYWRLTDDSPLTWAQINSSGGGAPSNADYLVKTATGDLSAERVVTDTATVTWDWATGGQAKAVAKRSAVMVLCAGFTPSETGADTAEFPAPYSPADGTASITWNLRRATLRVGTAGGAPEVVLEKSTASTAFSGTTLGTLTMGSGDHQVSITSFSVSTVDSGNKVRFNVSTLGTATDWTITLEMQEA